MYQKSKTRNMFKCWLVLLCVLQIVQLFSNGLACSPIFQPPYESVTIKGFGGDCYAKIIYPNHDSFRDARTEVYESKQDLEPIIVFSSVRRHIRLYCNRILEDQNGVVIVTVSHPDYDRSKALSFYFDNTFQEMYLAQYFSRKGVEIYENGSTCGGEILFWDSSRLRSTHTEIDIPDDEFGRKNLFSEYEEEHVSIINNQEVLSLVALDQSILLFDLLTGEFIGRKLPSNN